MKKHNPVVVALVNLAASCNPDFFWSGIKRILKNVPDTKKPDPVADALKSIAMEKPPESLRERVMKIQQDAIKELKEKELSGKKIFR